MFVTLLNGNFIWNNAYVSIYLWNSCEKFILEVKTNIKLMCKNDWDLLNNIYYIMYIHKIIIINI